VFFKAHEAAADAVNESRMSSALLDDVRDAIQDIADEDDDSYITPATDPAPDIEITPPGRPRRSARRSPRPD
jgi:hypothetical protein